MSAMRFLAQDGIDGFLASLSQGARVLAPVEKPAASRPSVVFEPWQKGQPYTLSKATVAPREAVFPECEVLFSFKRVRDEADAPKLELDAEPKAGATVVFGGRPCDAMGFAAIDKPFMDGLFKDPYYAARREKLTVITQTCDSGCETCFCHWVGGSPSSPKGSDVLMTRVEGGFVLQAVTARGRETLEKSGLPDGADKAAEMAQARKKAWEGLQAAPAIAAAPEKLQSLFTDADFWQEQTAQCLSCGACTYFCPTCYCFNITDEGEAQSEKGGRRLRSWDNCMSARYTREASGHNPRPKKWERMRNRVSHKFWTFPENWGAYLCSGCGRCIAHCPVHLDIRAIVLAAIACGK